MNIDRVLASLSDPERVAERLAVLQRDATGGKLISALSERDLHTLSRVLDISDFLFRTLCRHPEDLALLNQPLALSPVAGSDRLELVRHKYRNLFQISVLDIEGGVDREVLHWLSVLADNIVAAVHELLMCQIAGATGVGDGLRIAGLALGKLGSMELNYSSDVDLCFVCDKMDSEQLRQCYGYIRKLSRLLESRCEEGFLYRVDLNLRPWGRDAPLVLDMDATEGYYEASTEAWERFAWLRARPLIGDAELGNELLRRLGPFVFHRSLSMEEVERFMEIKQQMAMQRNRTVEWNIKTGVGGIRDIEFFVHLLQLLNGAKLAALRTSSTLQAMRQLWCGGLIQEHEYHSLCESYLFLRKLEHRVQMMDEQQTQLFPDDVAKRMRIACSMNYPDADPEAQLEHFLLDLKRHQDFSRQCFERVFEHV